MTQENKGVVPTVLSAPDISSTLKEYKTEAIQLYHNLARWDALAKGKGMVSPFYEGKVKETPYLVLTDPIMHVPENDRTNGNYFGLAKNGDMLLFWNVPILHLDNIEYTYRDTQAYDLFQFYSVNPNSKVALKIISFVANDIQQCLTTAVGRIQSYRPIIPNIPSAPIR